jgi:hypothetical protein
MALAEVSIADGILGSISDTKTSCGQDEHQTKLQYRALGHASFVQRIRRMGKLPDFVHSLQTTLCVLARSRAKGHLASMIG